MGTNYYARKIPTKSRKERLKALIDLDDFKNIQEEIGKTYGSFNIDYDRTSVGGVYHLGKRSSGWKFLWNPNIYIINNGHCETIEIEPGHNRVKWVKDPTTFYYVYPLTKSGIWDFINQDDIRIYNEYDEPIPTEEFYEMALNWGNDDSWDSKDYEEWEKSRDPYWRTYVCSGEYIEMLKSQGFKMISPTNSDFYSDGLRFATTNEFS